MLTSKLAEEIFNGLSAEAQKRLKDGKKPLVCNATVDQQGNAFTLLSLSEIAAV